jgi:hypothetical protein
VIRKETKTVTLKLEIERVQILLGFLKENIDGQIGDLKRV